jgi:hypothetical protein
MRTIIGGSRSIDDYNLVLSGINESKFIITEVICGLERGPDLFGERWALERKIPITYFPADWENFGKEGKSVNIEQMVNYAEALIAIYDGKSLGTQYLISYAKKRNIKCFILTTGEINEYNIFNLSLQNCKRT